MRIALDAAATRGNVTTVRESAMAEKKTPAKNDTPHLVEDLFAPELFATEASSFSIDSGVVSITLASHRYDHSETPPELKSVVIGRVVLPPAGARKLAAALYDFLAKNGMEPVPRPTEPTDMQ
jgi:hypothetical protein